MKLLRHIRRYYPVSLLALSLSPFVAGLLIDPDLANWRDVAINLMWIPIFSLPAQLMNKRWPLHVGVWTYLLFGIVEIAHWAIVRGPITVTSILVMGNSNFQEASEFMSLKSTPWLLLLLPFILLFVWAYRNLPSTEAYPAKKQASYVVLLISLVFIGETAIHGRLARKGVPQLIKVASAFNEQMEHYREANVPQQARMVHAQSTDSAQTMVLIIGESLSRNHMSLYGAKLPTNPLLSQRKDLILYTDVISSFSNTVNSILAMLSEVNREHDISMRYAVDILDVASSAGFSTYWITNQPPLGIWENHVTSFAKKADHIQFVNVASNSSVETNQTASYDERLIAPFKAALSDSSRKKFIVLHLMGSHSNYGKRYPASFARFKGTDSKQRTLAEYHNSILYNDHIIDQLLNIQVQRSADNQERICCVYLSDHGENVYDEGERAGHDYSKRVPRPNLEIPFMVWLSDPYEAAHPLKSQQIKEHSQLPFMTDDLFHGLMDLMHISTPIYQAERSIFNEQFRSQRLRIMEDERDYDQP